MRYTHRASFDFHFTSKQTLMKTKCFICSAVCARARAVFGHTVVGTPDQTNDFYLLAEIQLGNSLLFCQPEREKKKMGQARSVISSRLIDT